MVSVSVQVLKVNEYKHCVKFTYLNPDRKSEVTGRFKNGTIAHFLSYSTNLVKIFNNTTYAE